MRRRRRSRSRRSRSKSRSENEAGKSDVDEMEEKRGVGGGGSGGGSSGRSSRGEITPNISSNHSPMSPRSPARRESSLPNASQEKKQQQQQQPKPCLELPGFYFDEVKKRYFKILPKSFQGPAVVTQEVVQHIQAKKRETLKIVKKKESQQQQQHHKQKLLQQTLLPLGIEDTTSGTSSINDTLCSVGLEQLTLANDSFNDFDAKPVGTESKPPRPFSSTSFASFSSSSSRGNILSMLAGAQTGSFKSMRTTESRSMTTFVRTLMPWKRRKIFEKPRNTFEVRMRAECDIIWSGARL